MIKQNQLDKTLLEILENNSDTEYGKRYHFQYLRTADGYRFTVPLVKHEDVQPLIELTTRIGEQNIYTTEKLIAYALTSGTSEINHFVACNKSHIHAYVREFKRTLSESRGDNVLLMESIPKKIIYSDHAKLDTITGAILQELKQNLKRFRITSPESLLFHTSSADITYYRTLFALRSDRVTQITAPFCWSITEMIDCILENREKLIHDIRIGTITFDEKIPDEIKNELQSAFSASEKRAAQLEKVLFADNRDNMLKKLWPKLKKIVAVGTGRFEIYRDNLRRYSGSVELHNGYFACSEALVGIAVKGKDTYRMCNDNAYIEFLDVEAADGKTTLYDEVEIGKRYSVYVTNRAGLYRYRIGDIVEITDLKDGIPSFRYVGRTNEKVPESLLYGEIKKISAKYDIPINDYCFKANEDGSLTLFFETEQASELEKEKDAVIAMTAKELNVKEIRFLKPGAQIAYKRMRSLGGNLASDQLKPVRNLDDADKQAFFEFFLLK